MTGLFVSDTASHPSDPTGQLRWVHLILTTQLGLQWVLRG
jgi:hypothetical protein